LIACNEWVASVAHGTGTHGDVRLVSHTAVGVFTTHRLAIVAAGAHTIVPVAGLRSPALLGCSALARRAGGEGVTDVALRAGAHWSVITQLVVAWCAGGSTAARVGLTQVFSSELPAGLKGMSRVALGTATDRLVVIDAALSLETTGGTGRQLCTGILAAVLNTRLGK